MQFKTDLACIGCELDIVVRNSSDFIFIAGASIHPLNWLLTDKNKKVFLENETGMIYYHTGGDKK
jgi:hypothetical protein